MSTPHSAWRKSSFSNTGDCVELTPTAVRDSKNRSGPTLRFASLAGFLAAARSGGLDLPR